MPPTRSIGDGIARVDAHWTSIRPGHHANIAHSNHGRIRLSVRQYGRSSEWTWIAESADATLTGVAATARAAQTAAEDAAAELAQLLVPAVARARSALRDLAWLRDRIGWDDGIGYDELAASLKAIAAGDAYARGEP